MPRIPAELRLGRMRRLLKKLGDPQDALRVVHVAGTKGKGSTAVMIAAALSASGHSTGLFCSPHLHRLEERFRVDGVEATSDELVALVDELRPIVADFDSDETHHRHRGPTFFEITTAMGLMHFARKKADFVVLEVGLGGRLDSTNCVRPEVSVITSISFDHTKQLGTTLAAIAGEKAGIIKRGRPAVSGVEKGEARDAIRRVAKARRSQLIEIGEDFRYEAIPPEKPVMEPRAFSVRVRTLHRDWDVLNLPLLGRHQAHNAAVALATLDTLSENGLDVSVEDVAKGWRGLTWPARVEILGRSPWLVIDGAHNVASAEALAETLRTCLPDVPRTLVFGTTRDKDLKGQLRVLLPNFRQVIATNYLENPRAVPSADVANAVRQRSSVPVQIAESPACALELAHACTPPDGLIVVAGSLFLAAEARAVVLRLSS